VYILFILVFKFILCLSEFLKNFTQCMIVIRVSVRKGMYMNSMTFTKHGLQSEIIAVGLCFMHKVTDP
jgi:hypothetical protein